MPSGPVTVPLGVPHDYVAAVDALLAVALVLAGDDPGADEALARALRRTTQLPFPVGPFSEAVVQVYAGDLYRLRGDVEGARAVARVVSEIGDRHGFREHAMLGQVLVLAASTMEGDQAACEALENVLGIWRMTGGGLAVPVLLAELADGCLRAGDLERARSALDDAATMMAQTDQRGSESEVLRIAASLDRLGGRARWRGEGPRRCRPKRPWPAGPPPRRPSRPRRPRRVGRSTGRRGGRHRREAAGPPAALGRLVVRRRDGQCDIGVRRRTGMVR